jgi:DNA (cytosine-5)-methyltransferase 1
MKREPYKLLDLFSGIGGFSLGLERTGGFQTVAFCEINPFCRKVLRKHWPKVPQYDDIRTLTAERLAADGITVDAICGGFPCQDISWAGNGAGLAGERSGLWSEIRRLVGELRPNYVVVENVTALLNRGLSVVLGDLAALGYDAEWQDVSAEDIGAPHPRSRVWIVAYPSGSRLEGLWCSQRTEEEIANARRANDAANAAFIAGLHSLGKRRLSAILNAGSDRPCWAGQQWPETQSLLCRVDDGIPDRVDRTSALGNAVVPQIPELIGRAILAAETEAA